MKRRAQQEYSQHSKAKEKMKNKRMARKSAVCKVKSAVNDEAERQRSQIEIHTMKLFPFCISYFLLFILLSTEIADCSIQR